MKHPPEKKGAMSCFVMRNYFIPILLFFLAAIHADCQAQKSEGSTASSYISKVWVADNGDGTYKNPVLFADYSDPDVIRIGDDFYLTASSFNSSPGLPVLHSKDLVNWRIVNYALKVQEPAEVYNVPQHGKGVWAPCLVWHDQELRIYYGDPDYGIYMVKTKDPLGEWEKPVCVLAAKGVIDPSVLFDDDGKSYMVTAWAASRAGINSLLTVYPMNAEGTAVTGEGIHIYDGHEQNHTIEGPKLFKRQGYYYISAPAGGVETGWQVVLRSENIYGPYEGKKVLHQGNTAVNGPHQGAIVDTKSGESWFLHFQDRGVYGRILHMQPVKWKDGWPLMGIDINKDGIGEPVAYYKKPGTGNMNAVETPQESDEFNDGKLGMQWQWHANKDIRWSLMLPDSDYLRLFSFPVKEGTKNLWNVPNLLLQKLPAEAFTATAKVKFTVEWDVWQGKKAGLLIMGNDYAYLSVQKDEKGYYLNQVVCKDAAAGTGEQINAAYRLKTNEVYMRVSLKQGGLCQFSFSEDGSVFTPVGDIFQAKPDKWIGAKAGLFSISEPGVRTGGYADFDWFRISK